MKNLCVDWKISCPPKSITLKCTLSFGLEILCINSLKMREDDGVADDDGVGIGNNDVGVDGDCGDGDGDARGEAAGAGLM